MTGTDEWFSSFPDDFWLQGARGADDRAQARQVAKLLQLRRGQCALDVPCGRGRIAFHLARRGISVVGVDASRRFVHSARERFRRNALAGEFILGDMRGIDFEERFHAAYNWFGSFGYFSDRDNAAFLRRLADAVRPGGRVLVEQVHRECMLRHFRTREERRGVRITVRWNRRAQRTAGSWVRLDDPERRPNRFSIRLYTLAQLSGLLHGAGLAVEVICDSDGRPLTRASRRLIVVGRKAR